MAPENLPASEPPAASQFYARNISALLLNLVKDGALVFGIGGGGHEVNGDHA